MIEYDNGRAARGWRRWLSTSLVLMLILSGGDGLAAAPEKPARRSTVLAIAGGGSYREAFDMKVVEALLVSTEFVNPIVKEATGLSPEQWRGLVRIELTPVGSRSSQLVVTVLPGEGVDSADRVADDVIRLLSSRAAESFDRLYRTNKRKMDQDYDGLLTRKQELEAQQKQLQLALRKLSRPQAPDAGLRERQELTLSIRSLRDTVLKIETKLNAARTMLQEIREEEPEQGMDSTVILDLIEARAQLVRVLEAQEPRDELALANARAALAEVRYAYARLKWDLQKGQVPVWARRITEMRYELAHSTARLEAYEERLIELEAQASGPGLTPEADHEEMNFRMQTVRQELSMVRKSLNEIENSNSREALSPQLIVVTEATGNGGADDAAKQNQ